MSGLDSKDVELIDKSMEENGLAGVKSALMNRIDQWKKEQLNIAVIGQSGVGKSSFINTIRDLKPTEDGAAEVDVVEMTMDMKAYTHPIYPNLAFWDVPGVGTQRWPKETYLNDIGFEKYDFYLILTATRFMELDIWLAQKVQESGKKCFFVRTKIDQDVYNDKMNHPETFEKETTIEKIRKYCRQQVAMIGEETQTCLHNPSIFLISTMLIKTHEFDFKHLKEQLVAEFPVLKKDVILLALSGRTKNLLEKKQQMLENRIPKVAIMSAIGGAFPVPGVSLMVDIGIMKSELEFYRQQFGLDENSLKYVDSMANKPGEDVAKWKVVRDALQGSISLTCIEILEQVMVHGASEVAEGFVAMVPIVGTLVAAGLSYSTTYAALHILLKETAEKGFKVLEMINEAIKEEAELD